MAVFAHPDDETFICGGALAKYVKFGCEVTLVCATKGEMGRRLGIPPMETRETIAGVRQLELQAACQALGIKSLDFLGYRDKTLEIQPQEVLSSVIRSRLEVCRPDVIVTFHEKWGGHPDHCAIGEATTSAFLDYRKDYQNTLLMFVCSGDMIRNPNTYGLSSDQLVEVDVTDYLYEKLGAFRAHRSQSGMNDWLWQEDKLAVSKLWSKEYLLEWATLQRH